MALPGLVRVATVARILGVNRVTVRAHLMRAGASLVRRPRVSAKDRDGPWYVTVEGALALIDHLLPAHLERKANRRARQALARDAALMGCSGQCVAYRDGGTGSGEPRPESAPHTIPQKSQGE